MHNKGQTVCCHKFVPWKSISGIVEKPAAGIRITRTTTKVTAIQLVAKYLSLWTHKGVFPLINRATTKTIEEIPKDKINHSKPIKPTQQQNTENTQDKKKKSGIFIKMPTENPEKAEKLKNLLSIFEGKIPVYLYYEDTKKYDFLPHKAKMGLTKTKKDL